ncbi:hypothetical protein STEG23_018629, partial [Scotinomys teguina]
GTRLWESQLSQDELPLHPECLARHRGTHSFFAITSSPNALGHTPPSSTEREEAQALVRVSFSLLLDLGHLGIFINFYANVCDLRRQKRASDPMESQMVVKLQCGCWESNTGPPQEQQVLFTAEPSLRPRVTFFSFSFSY